MYRRVAALAIAAFSLAGCEIVDKITGAPKRLNNAEAALRYLSIACPSNVVGDKMNAEYEKSLAAYKDGKASSVEWGKFLDSYLLKSADRDVSSSKLMTNPGFVWPESVKDLVSEKSAAELESASSSREFVRKGGFTAASKEEGPWPDIPGEEAGQRAADKASAIRSALQLPPRSEGCKNGKPALTLEQIKKLQGS